MNYKKVIIYYFNRKSPLAEDKKEKYRLPHQTHYWKTFTNSEKAFFWIFSFGFIASFIFLLQFVLG
ncbi:MAG: hypothetical protein ACJ0QO_04295 [Parvicellaceae bacterium]